VPGPSSPARTPSQLFVARDQVAGALEAVSYALPLTYA
jgi:hypothetical protein